MGPTGEWDRDEVFERIPWKHLSRDLGRFSGPPLVWGLIGVVVLAVVGSALAFRPNRALSPIAGVVTTTSPVPVPVPADSVVVTLPSSPISEADLFAEPPGAGELRAMTLAESHVRSVMSSDATYVEWTSTFEVLRVGDEWWVDVTAGVLKVEEGAYLPMHPVALRVGVGAQGVSWSTPIEPIGLSVRSDRRGGSEVSAELVAEFSAAVAELGTLVEVVDAGLEEGSLWGVVLVETPSGIRLSLEVWPGRNPAR